MANENTMKTPPSPASQPQEVTTSAAGRVGSTGVLSWMALLSVYMYMYGI